jgi:hypothetical protein
MRRTTNVEGFVVQSERSNLSSDPHGATFIAWVHGYFRGQLVWDMSVNQLMTGPPVAGAQNWYDPYPPVPTATPSSAGSALGEVGILATDGAFVQSSLTSLLGTFKNQFGPTG